MSPTSDHCKESLVCFLLYQCWALIRPLPEYPDFALYYKEPESLVWGQVWGQVSSCSPEGRHRWSGCWGSPNHKSGFGPGQPLGWSAKWAMGETLPCLQLLGWLTQTCLMQLVFHLFWPQGQLSHLPQALMGRREEGNSSVPMLSEDKLVTETVLPWL